MCSFSLVVFLTVCASDSANAEHSLHESQQNNDQGLQGEFFTQHLNLGEQQLTVLEQSLPVLHQIVTTDEWQAMNAFDKLRLLSPYLREKWGSDRPYDSVNAFTELELASSAFDLNVLNTTLNRASNVLLHQFITSEQIRQTFEGAFGAMNVHLERAFPSTAETMATCLTDNLRLGDECSLEVENGFQNSVTSCIAELDRTVSTNVVDSGCISNGSTAMVFEFSSCNSKVRRNIVLCLRDVEKEMSKHLEEN